MPKYDPFILRREANKITKVQGLFLLILSARTSIWEASLDFRNMGLLGGLTYIIITSVIVVHCIHIAFRGMHVICCKRFIPYITYTEALTVTLRDRMKSCFWITYVFQFVLAFMIWFFHFSKICLDFIRVVGLIEDKVHLNAHRSGKILDILVFIPHMLVLFIHKMRNLAMLSVLSSVTTCLYFIAGEMNTISHEKYLFYQDPEPFAIFKFAQMGLGISGRIVEATLPIGVYMVIEKHVVEPKKFVKPFGILNIGIVTMILAHTIVGMFSYCYYRINTKSNNYLFEGKITGKALILGEMFAVMISFGVHGYCAVTIFWYELIKPFYKKKMNTYTCITLLRFGTCVLVFLIGLFVNENIFLLVVKVIRGITVPFFGFIGPVLLDIFNRDNYGRFKIVLITDILIVVGAITYSFIYVYSYVTTWRH